MCGGGERGGEMCGGGVRKGGKELFHVRPVTLAWIHDFFFGGGGSAEAETVVDKVYRCPL